MRTRYLTPLTNVSPDNPRFNQLKKSPSCSEVYFCVEFNDQICPICSQTSTQMDWKKSISHSEHLYKWAFSRLPSYMHVGTYVHAGCSRKHAMCAGLSYAPMCVQGPQSDCAPFLLKLQAKCDPKTHIHRTYHGIQQDLNMSVNVGKHMCGLD